MGLSRFPWYLQQPPACQQVRGMFLGLRGCGARSPRRRHWGFSCWDASPYVTGFTSCPLLCRLLRAGHLLKIFLVQSSLDISPGVGAVAQRNSVFLVPFCSSLRPLISSHPINTGPASIITVMMERGRDGTLTADGTNDPILCRQLGEVVLTGLPWPRPGPALCSWALLRPGCICSSSGVCFSLQKGCFLQRMNAKSKPDDLFGTREL